MCLNASAFSKKGPERAQSEPHLAVMRRPPSLSVAAASVPSLTLVVTKSLDAHGAPPTTLAVASVPHVDVSCRSPPDAGHRSASSVAQRSRSASPLFADTQRSRVAQLLAPKLTGRLGMSILLQAAHQQVPIAASVLTASPGFSTFLAAGSPILGSTAPVNFLSLLSSASFNTS